MQGENEADERGIRMSIKKIAQMAGVSPATVSRVLNNPDYQPSSPNTREKIWKAAMEMNYVPNEAARNLRTGKKKDQSQSFHINVLLTRTSGEEIDPFFMELLNVAESEIHKQMCVLSHVWNMPIFSNDKKCRTTNIDNVIDEMYAETAAPCDGLLIIGRCNKEALKKLKKRFKCLVSINRNSTNYEVDEIVCDGAKIARMAVEHLISLGHTKIGYIGACHNESRYRGFISALEKHGIDYDETYVIETKQTESEGYEAVKFLMQSDDAPTAIYCANDITAVGALRCLNTFKNYYYLPSIISSDNIAQAQETKPMLTTVGLPKDEMGRLAVKLLIDRIRGEHTSVIRMELEGRLIIRQSCTPVDESRWCEYYI